MNTNNNILGVAPIGSLIIKMSLPTIAAQIVNLLYNVVDRMFVGRIPEVGSLALAGLGVTFPIIMLISAFAMLAQMGAPLAAIAMGKNDYKKAEKYLGNSVILMIFFSVMLSVIFYITKDKILLAFGASENTLPFASSYISIYLIGTIFVQSTLVLNSYITNQGFSKTSMATICIGAIMNIILDPIFIYFFNMGVRGAALATIISQCISSIWVIAFLLGRKTLLKIRFANLIPNKKIILSTLALGVSPFIMNATECAIQLTFNTGMIKYGNDMYVAIMSILFSVMQFVWLPMSGLGQGVQPIIGFNFGAGNFTRVKKAFKLLFTVCVIFSVFTIAIVEFFPGFFLGLFTNDLSLIENGKNALRIFMIGMAAMGAQSACQQTFLALGEAKISMFLAILRKIILLLPLAIIIPKMFGLGIWGLFLAEPISDLLAASTTTILFMVRSKKILK